MGLLDLQEWNVSPKTNWITYGAKKNSKYNYPSPYLRKIFSIEKPIKNARAYATALGLYQLTINGNLITEDLLRPGNTNYNKRIQYQTYDITTFLSSGQNVIGAILADGWYRGHSGMNLQRNAFGHQIALLVRIIITADDGTELRIGSDDSWKASFRTAFKIRSLFR